MWHSNSPLSNSKVYFYVYKIPKHISKMSTTLMNIYPNSYLKLKCFWKEQLVTNHIILNHFEWTAPEVPSSVTNLPNYGRIRAKRTKEFFRNKSLPCLLRNKERTMLSPVYNGPSREQSCYISHTHSLRQLLVPVEKCHPQKMKLINSHLPIVPTPPSAFLQRQLVKLCPGTP